jgi:putative transposase
MRLEPDRRHLTLPVIGTLRSKENTRRLERLLAKGQARVLSMTLSEQSGRLLVSVATVVARTPCARPSPMPAAGSTLASVLRGL